MEVKERHIKFLQFLKENLTASDFENMAAWLDTSAHKKTKILNDPASCSLGLLAKFAYKLDIHTYLLVENYELAANNVPVSMFKDMKKTYAKDRILEPIVITDNVIPS